MISNVYTTERNASKRLNYIHTFKRIDATLKNIYLDIFLIAYNPIDGTDL